ncbi:UNVERIFIED_CONTAM: hypothetical protein RMT77_015497 [Armadillidium vulgare]
MALIRVLALLLVSMTVAFATPRYIAIPIEDLGNIAVVAQPAYRQARSFVYEPEVSETNVQEEYVQAPSAVEENRPKRGSSGYGPSSHVDYGAYTGAKGAFGWYADYPVGHHK